MTDGKVTSTGAPIRVIQLSTSEQGHEARMVERLQKSIIFVGWWVLLAALAAAMIVGRSIVYLADAVTASGGAG